MSLVQMKQFYNSVFIKEKTFSNLDKVERSIHTGKTCLVKTETENLKTEFSVGFKLSRLVISLCYIDKHR